MKYLLCLSLILYLSGCEDDDRNYFDYSADSGSDTDDFQTDDSAERKAETVEEKETSKTIFKPEKDDTGSEVSELQTETVQTDTEHESETKEDSEETNAVTADCNLTLDMMLKCLGNGSRFQHLKDSCDFNSFDDWSSCLIDCLSVSNCDDFLLCEGRC